MNNIFVGNLSFEATKEDVEKLFGTFGHVANVLIMKGKKDKSRGFGFVDMPNEEEKNAAIAGLAGKEFMWRVISVSPVIPKVREEVTREKRPRPQRRDDRKPRSEPPSKEPSKYYSKFDGPPKPWQKGSSGAKPARPANKGARPYYGKKDKEGPKPAGTSKFFMKPIKKGFKMKHKVAGLPKSIKSTDGL
jgi:RNA recognition motif-containing protein